ncbi:MAG: hypothetical protein DI537_32140 [Stutzerimonas stutzeri]|nr:MAG: hypothetical protein DI537_32140 [Stutzerimonas stutzeri]
MTLDPTWIVMELAAIDASSDPTVKGRRLEALIRAIFFSVPGLDLEDQDVESAYLTEEIDLYFWNDREREGLHFMDCPLLVECKAWSKPASGRELRYFATTLKDKDRSSGIFVALKGLTGNPAAKSAGFFHVASAMAAGQTVLLITGDDIAKLTCGTDLVRLLRRRLTDQVRDQVLATDAKPK